MGLFSSSDCSDCNGTGTATTTARLTDEDGHTDRGPSTGPHWLCNGTGQIPAEVQ